MSDRNYAIFLIISEIVITAIAFFGAYLIFKPLFRKKKPDEQAADQKDATED